MALDDDIATAIDNDLPNQIGARLKERLVQAEEDATDVAHLRRKVIELEREKQRWDLSRTKEEEIQAREKVVTIEERALEIRTARISVQEEYCTKNRADMITLVTQVFKGPASKMAFELYGGASGLYIDNMSQSPSVNLTGKLETEDE